MTPIWLFLGVIAVIPLLYYVHKKSETAYLIVLGRALIIAATIYFIFAIIWGDVFWLLIEFLGIVLFSLFYWLAIKFTPMWMALGWVFHPFWDGLLHLYGPGYDIAPVWYATACISFDLVIAVYIAYRVYAVTLTKSA